MRMSNGFNPLWSGFNSRRFHQPVRQAMKGQEQDKEREGDGMRDGVDTRQIVRDMRDFGLHGVVSTKDLMEYTGRSRNWCTERFGNISGGISIVSAARVLGGLYDNG